MRGTSLLHPCWHKHVCAPQLETASLQDGRLKFAQAEWTSLRPIIETGGVRFWHQVQMESQVSLVFGHLPKVREHRANSHIGNGV